MINLRVYHGGKRASCILNLNKLEKEMSIKENLEKASALFGDSHEPECVVMTEESKQKIIGDNFDITKYEFYDSEVSARIESDGDLKVAFGERDKVVRYFNKEDGVAIAKALGVTADDLI